MDSEKAQPLALSDEEVKNGIIYRVSESLSKTCHLNGGNAYTKVEGEIIIRLRLSDYGREVLDNHIVPISLVTDVPQELSGAEYTVEHTENIEALPPNEFRITTGQDVPTPVEENGKRVIKNLKYSPRKPKAKANG